MSVDPTKIPPLAQSTVGDVEIVCCLSCCPSWFGRVRTPRAASSPAGFEPKLAPIAKAIVDEVHRSRAGSTASRRPSLASNVIAVATGIVEEKPHLEEAKDAAKVAQSSLETTQKVETAAISVLKAGRGGN